MRWRWMGHTLVEDHGHRPAVLAAGNRVMLARDTDGRLVEMKVNEDPNAELLRSAPELREALHALVEKGDLTPDSTNAEWDAYDGALTRARALLARLEE